MRAHRAWLLIGITALAGLSSAFTLNEPSALAQTQSASARTGASNTTPLTYYKNVAPIIDHNCASCHRPTQPGPFPLLTYTDVRKHAPDIVTVIKRHYMPPWLPQQGYGSFVDERRLSDEQIRTIVEWVQQGAKAGSPADAPPPSKFTPGWQLGRPDLVVEATSPFHMPADGQDQYWNFVLHTHEKTARWVKAIEIRPGNLKPVHHANMYTSMRISRSASGKPVDDGFPGMDVSNVSGSFDSDSHFLFWKPGGNVWVEPADMAWRLDPGSDLILNVHMRATGKPELEQPSVGFYFTDKPGTKKPMALPLEHDGALDIPAGNSDFQVSDDFVVPMDMDVLAIYPHAHYLGHLLEGYATLPDKTRKWLIRIQDWDPSWQAVYRYKDPVFLPKGTVVSMRYHYDNSVANVRNPNEPPKRVRAGNQTTDEMAHLSLQVLPRGSQDRRNDLEEAIMLHRLEKYPGDFLAQYNLGTIRLGHGDKADGIKYLRGAVQARPDNASALGSLGVAVLSTGNVNEAVGFLQRAVQADPHATNTHYELALALSAQQRWDVAAAEFRTVLAQKPDDAAARTQYGMMLRMWGNQSATTGKLDDAVLHWRESLAFRMDDAGLHNDLGAILARLGRVREAIPEFEAAVRLDPKMDSARRNLDTARALLK